MKKIKKSLESIDKSLLRIVEILENNSLSPKESKQETAPSCKEIIEEWMLGKNSDR